MKNNEHLALFVLGVGTLGITFLLLFAISDRNTASIPVVDKHIQAPAVQAAVDPKAQLPEPPRVQAVAGPETRASEPSGMEVLDRQVAETFARAAAYLGRGTFEEKEHIALLERLEFYGGMSSIKMEHKKAAQDFIKDMGRLLTLKESVARQVKLAGQISAVETDVQIHLASGERNKAAARELMDRIESLYAIRGLSATQNRQLRTSLAALKNAYETTEDTSASSAPASSGQADAPEVPKPSAPAPILKSKVEPKTKSSPVPKVPAAATAPQKARQPDPQTVMKKYNTVMTYVARYFVVKKYDQQKHDELTADLHEIAKNSTYLSEEEQKRLRETIEKMKRIDMKYSSKFSTK